jgi:hypothetical protein
MILLKDAKAQRETPQTWPGPNRREFLRGMGRWFLTGAGIAGIGGLAARRGQACSNDFLCRDCPARKGCELPQAREFHAKTQRRKEENRKR